MKSKIIFSLILSAVLLTACNSEQSLIDKREDADTSAVQQSAETVTTAVESSTEVSKEVNAEETDADGDITSSELFDHFSFDLGKFEKGGGVDGHTHGMFVSESVVCESYFWWDLSDDVTHRYLRFYNVDSGTMEAEIELPDNFETYCFRGADDGEGNVLMRAYIGCWTDEENTDGGSFGEITVRSDYSYDIETDTSRFGVWERGGSILKDGVTLIGGIDGSGEKNFRYEFSIDENRFVYKTTTSEGWDNFGLYDISKGSGTEFADTRDFFPVGYYKGKIYAQISTADSEGIGEIYSFDAETSEKEKFIAIHTADDRADEFIECFMPSEEAGYIAAEFYPDMSSNVLYIISLDSGEILAKHESDNSSGGTKAMDCIGGRIALVSSDNTVITIFDKKI